MARASGLGKGLGALIPVGAPESAAPTGAGGVHELPIASIRPNPYQPRAHFDEESLGELSDSIREVGLLQPVLVRPAGDGYELIAGERRWRAAGRAGLEHIPALVRESDDSRTLVQALVENLQREELNVLEEAGAYQQLIEDFQLTHEQVAVRVGKSRASVSNSLRLLALPPSIQRLLRERRISMGHARALLGTPDRAFQEQLAAQITREDLSVRAVEERVREHTGSDRAPDRSNGSGRGRLRPAGLLELEELLGDFLETRVRVALHPGRPGRVTIDFADLDDLERLYRRMTDPAITASPEK